MVNKHWINGTCTCKEEFPEKSVGQLLVASWLTGFSGSPSSQLLADQLTTLHNLSKCMNSIATYLPFSQHKFDIQVKCYNVSMQTPVYFIIEVLMRFVLRWWVLIPSIILEFKRFIKWNYFEIGCHCDNSCINDTLHFETSLLQKTKTLFFMHEIKWTEMHVTSY